MALVGGGGRVMVINYEFCLKSGTPVTHSPISRIVVALAPYCVNPFMGSQRAARIRRKADEKRIAGPPRERSRGLQIQPEIAGERPKVIS